MQFVNLNPSTKTNSPNFLRQMSVAVAHCEFSAEQKNNGTLRRSQLQRRRAKQKKNVYRNVKWFSSAAENWRRRRRENGLNRNIISSFLTEGSTQAADEGETERDEDLRIHRKNSSAREGGNGSGGEPREERGRFYTRPGFPFSLVRGETNNGGWAEAVTVEQVNPPTHWGGGGCLTEYVLVWMSFPTRASEKPFRDGLSFSSFKIRFLESVFFPASAAIPIFVGLSLSPSTGRVWSGQIRARPDWVAAMKILSGGGRREKKGVGHGFRM